MKETRGESYSQILIGSAAPHSDLACFWGGSLEPIHLHELRHHVFKVR